MVDESLKVETNEKEEKSPDEKLLEQARRHFKMCAEAENDFRVGAIDDLNFLAGDQWDEKDLRAREEDGRPCLKINKLPAHVRQVENDNRQNRPAIKVRPVDSKADPETAGVLQGLIRAIERNSNADVAYDRAFSGAVRARRGWFRILTDWESPTSFHQVIKFGSIRNPLMVHADPAFKEPDGSDIEFLFISDWIPEEHFRAKYPNAKKTGADEFKSIGDDAASWINDERAIRVAEYFYIEWVDDSVVLFPDGSTGLESELRKLEAEKPEEHAQMVMQRGLPVNKRETRVPKVRWCLLTGAEVLEKRDWPGRWIPVVPSLAEELDVNGKLIYKGLISDAKDSQRLLNYMKSSEVETIALAPKAPFIGVEGQFKNHEHKWQTANKKTWPYLEFKPVSIGGQMIATPPQRQNYEPAIQAITMATREANDDLKASTGINDASMGMRSNETSGVGIMKRAQQAHISNFHFTDNLTRAIRHGGRIILDLIPHIYDTARVVQILGEDDQEKVVLINQMIEGGKGHFFDRGQYDIAVDTGPSFLTKRQEASEMMADLATKVPQLMQVAGDLLVGNMDIPMAKEIADRLKASLPPGVVKDESAKQQLPPAVAAELQRLSQMIEQLSKANHALHDERDQKTRELESKERIALENNKAAIEIALLKAQSTEGIALLNAQISEIQHRLDILHAREPIGSDDPEMGEPDQDEFQAAGAEGAGQFEQPTGGPSPGQSMELP